MRERFDFVAFNEIGAYAICLDDGRAGSRRFVAEALRLGHRVERMPVERASKLHLAFIHATKPTALARHDAQAGRSGGEG